MQGENIKDTQWELEIDYGNGHKVSGFSGDNAYTYNFEAIGIVRNRGWVENARGG